MFPKHQNQYKKEIKEENGTTCYAEDGKGRNIYYISDLV